MRRLRLLIAVALVAGAGMARAEATGSRTEAAGYFRVMARPDLQGGDGRLGFWNLYGRLLNEGPWAALELKVELVRRTEEKAPWARAHLKLEGGSIMGADAGRGRLDAFGLTQVYAVAGNLGLEGVQWQVGTLDVWMGDLGLYDLKPAQLLFGTVGLSATWQTSAVDLTLALGDSGFFQRPSAYSPMLTGAALVRWRAMPGHLEVGGGAQAQVEPNVAGNRYAPHQTPEVTYEQFLRGEMVSEYLKRYPGGQEDLFYANLPPEGRSASSWKAVFYLGVGGYGPWVWTNVFGNVQRLHPNNFVTESLAGRDYTVWVHDLTDERYEVNLGQESLFHLVPGRLDAAWAALFGRHWNRDNELSAGEDNRQFVSTVLRLKLYLTQTLHLLLETSLAREQSLQGNLWRLAHDSIFQSQEGLANNLGLEFGDTDRRDTWQLKGGPVWSPAGAGIWARPSLRLLLGYQQSNVHDAFATTLQSSLSDFDELQAEARSRYRHLVLGLEVEAWF